jgi:hypothetical protein
MAFPRLFKQKVPTLEQMDGLIRFVDEGSLANAFGKGKGDQGKGTQKLGRIDRCFGIRTRMSSGGGKVPTPEAEELAGICRAFFQKLEDFKSRSERAPNSFVVGAGDTLTFYLLIPALKRAEAWRATAQLHRNRSTFTSTVRTAARLPAITFSDRGWSGRLGTVTTY